MSNFDRFIARAFLTFFASIIGFIISFQLGNSNVQNWIRLPNPPEKVVDILTADDEYFFVKTTDGKIYSCRVQRDCSLIDSSQVGRERVPNSNFSKMNVQSANLYPPLQSPGKMVAIGDYQLYVSPVTFKTWQYVAYEDGSVWRLYSPPRGDIVVVPFENGFAGGCLGAIIGLIGSGWLLSRKSSNTTTAYR